MSKVKITQEQADAIESLLNSKIVKFGYAIKTAIEQDWVVSEYKPLNEIGFDKFIRVIRDGYEVEPQFKLGDWVIYEDEIGNSNILKIIDIQYGNYRVQFDELSNWQKIERIFRHATPEEIAKEKERRWWDKHDRDVWEIREDDILEYLNDLYIIDSFDSEEVCLKSGIERKTNYAEPFDFVKKHFKVICFAKDRKDV